MQWIIKTALRRYWRHCRGLLLDVQAVVFNDHEQVLLVRPSETADWRLPGDGVRRGETAEDALLRALGDIGVTVTAAPALASIEARDQPWPGGHDVMFVVRHWQRTESSGISEIRLFDADALPSDLPARERRWVMAARSLDQQPVRQSPGLGTQTTKP